MPNQFLTYRSSRIVHTQIVYWLVRSLIDCFIYICLNRNIKTIFGATTRYSGCTAVCTETYLIKQVSIIKTSWNTSGLEIHINETYRINPVSIIKAIFLTPSNHLWDPLTEVYPVDRVSIIKASWNNSRFGDPRTDTSPPRVVKAIFLTFQRVVRRVV